MVIGQNRIFASLTVDSGNQLAPQYRTRICYPP